MRTHLGRLGVGGLVDKHVAECNLFLNRLGTQRTSSARRTARRGKRKALDLPAPPTNPHQP